ncbi:unnamed protein product [Adineta steineri]|uniref:Hint domain-containing protein n=1 Tax=Adineta steineri TaxID=433720 RepID=A0A814ZD52_9BILA|nr:unnamed protein product [Adineta steineri]CAF3562292.1 unnamed protein product [Adineta steineri]
MLGATADSTEVSVGCFSSDSYVVLNNGKQKSIGFLQTGDEILAVNHLKVNSSEMFLMLDQETSKLALFYTFRTASNHHISLTGLHLIPIILSNNKIEYIAARNVKLGDQFYVLINDQLESSPVVNITIESKNGYFAPLTMTGTILVNNVYASCFASVKNHELAQIFMTPFRWYYQLANFISITEPFNNNNNRTNGIHWFVKFIYQLAIYIQPSNLQL